MDCHPIEDSSAHSLEISLRRVCDFYGLDSDAYITTDNATSNVSAFSGHRFRCMAHALNSACSHLTSNTRQNTSTYGLTVEERKEVREFFKTVDTVCSIFRTKSAFTDLSGWYEEKKGLMGDIQVNMQTPLEPCETRWIEQINNLKWLRKFGVLVYRYLICGHNHTIDVIRLHSCLFQLPEVLVLLNLLNNAINLLAPEEEGSFHLVLPVLYKLRVMLHVFHPRESVGILIKKSLLYELDNGCLVIPDKNLQFYQCASACYPRLKDICKDIYDECMAVGEKCYSSYYNSLDESQKELGTRSSESLHGIVESEVLTLTKPKDDDIRALDYGLMYMEEDPFLIGYISPVDDDNMDVLLCMSEAEITRLIKATRKSIKRKEDALKVKEDPRLREEKRVLESKQKIYELWKENGGSRDDDLIRSMLPQAGVNQIEMDNHLSTMVSKKKGSNLYCRYNTLFRSKSYSKTYSPADLFVELCLCFASTEAACERFFRYLSLIEKKQYRLNLDGTKACQLAVLRYYSSEIYQWMGKGKTTTKKTLYDIMYMDD